MAEISSQVPPKYVIIRDNCNEMKIEEEFYEALQSKAKYIIIEPFTLGELSVKWIRLINFSHKASVVSGMVCLIWTYSKEETNYINISFGICSVLFAGLYALSSRDPCCKYQSETSLKCLEKLPVRDLTSSSPIVLVRRDDTRRKWLHNIVALSSGGLCAWKLYKWFYD